MTTLGHVGNDGARFESTVTYVSPPVEIPVGKEVAWFVRAESSMPLLRHPKTFIVSDSSLIQIQERRPALSCAIPPAHFCQQ